MKEIARFIKLIINGCVDILESGCCMVYSNRKKIQYLLFFIGGLIALVIFLYLDFPTGSDALKNYFLIYMACPSVLAFLLHGVALCLVGINDELTHGKGIVDVEGIEMNSNDGLKVVAQKIIYIMLGQFLAGFKGYFLAMGLLFVFKLYARGG